MNKKYAICYNPEIENASSVMKKMEQILRSLNLTYVIHNINELNSNCDFAFIIGGDGTILKAARYFSHYNIPIFGINLGHLGFLSQACELDVENSINQIVQGNYKIEERIMLTTSGYNALNDFVIKGAETSRASKFLLEIDGYNVCEYFADGIIVSTPTGSTAYGMAAGGPVIAPNVNALTIVPICPHTFAARPIVVCSDTVIKIRSSVKQKYIVSADGQEVFSFADEIELKKFDKPAKLALLNSNDFYSVLRNKLHWGISPSRCL